MLTIGEIKTRITEIGEEVTVSNQYEIAKQIHKPVSYPLGRDFDSETEQKIVSLPEAQISREA